MKVKAKGQTPAEIFFLSKVMDGTIKITKAGTVFNTKTNRFIGATGSGGYPKISMARNNRNDIQHIQIHRLNWLVHRGDINPTLELNHKDGNKNNPDLENLEEITRSGNMQHALKNGLKTVLKGQNNPNAIFSNIEVVRLRKMYRLGLTTLDQAAKRNKVHKVTVTYILTGKSYPKVKGPVGPMFSVSDFYKAKKNTIEVLKTKNLSKVMKELEVGRKFGERLLRKFV